MSYHHTDQEWRIMVTRVVFCFSLSSLTCADCFLSWHFIPSRLSSIRVWISRAPGVISLSITYVRLFRLAWTDKRTHQQKMLIIWCCLHDTDCFGELILSKQGGECFVYTARIVQVDCCCFWLLFPWVQVLWCVSVVGRRREGGPNQIFRVPVVFRYCNQNSGLQQEQVMISNHEPSRVPTRECHGPCGHGTGPARRENPHGFQGLYNIAGCKDTGHEYQ